MKYYLMNISSVVELNFGENYVALVDNILNISDSNSALFSVVVKGTNADISIEVTTIDDSCHKIINLRNRDVFKIDSFGEFIFWQTGNSAEYVDLEEDILLNFYKESQQPMGLDVHVVLRKGAQKIQPEELLSIVAQIDIPEIDQ